MIVSAAEILAEIGTVETRRRLDKPRRSHVVPGTNSCYTMNKCRRPECREAHNAYYRAHRESRRGKTPPDYALHGTENTYNYWCCRCAVCREAHRLRQIDIRAKKKRKRVTE